MRRLLTLLAVLAIASGTAGAESPPAPGPLAGHTLSCTVGGAPLYGGCYYEIPAGSFGPLSFSVGLDAQLAAPTSERGSHFAPYVLLALTLETWGAWVEVSAPKSWGIPVIGRAEAFRLGFTYQFR